MVKYDNESILAIGSYVLAKTLNTLLRVSPVAMWPSYSSAGEAVSFMFINPEATGGSRLTAAPANACHSHIITSPVLPADEFIHHHYWHHSTPTRHVPTVIPISQRYFLISRISYCKVKLFVK